MNLKFLPIMLGFGLLGACSTLPSSGPTGGQIEDSVRESVATGLDIGIVPVNTVADVPPAVAPIEWQLPYLGPPPSDMVGAGDVLSISVFEAGITLFGGDSRGTGIVGGFDPSVRVQTLPPRRVNDDGFIDIPYVGRLRVAGKTVSEVQNMIRSGLRNLSQDPRVVVNREQVIGNSVIVNGEVVQPGRLVLETNRENMVDIIALAGGYRGDAKDLVLMVERGDDIARLRLSDALAGTYDRLRAYPGDRLTVLTEPMTFSVLGATGRVQQMPFARDSMSVVEAIAAAGGPNGSTGDPESIFLFRYAGPDSTLPTVYHFNMMQTPTYFLAQKFALRDDDILYFGNAASNQPRKLIQTIGLLFSPIVTATATASNLD